MAAAFFDWMFGSDEGIKKNANLNIQETLAIVNTGDILLFRGWSPTSSFIQVFTASTWSHIALVIRGSNGRPMVFESIHSDDDHADKKFKPLNDLITGAPRVGVRLVDMEAYLNSIVNENNAMAKKGGRKRIKVVLRQWTVPHIPKIYEEMNAHLNAVGQEFIQKHRGKKYEFRWWEMVQARFQFGDTSGKLTPDTLFCSELVSMFLLDAGLFHIKYETPNMMLPDDFSEANRLTLRYPASKLSTLKGQFDNPDTVVKYSRELIIDTVTPIPKVRGFYGV